MDKLKMQTPDMTQVNINKIAEIFPNVITETRDDNGNVKKAVDYDLLKQVLSGELVEGSDERYRLDWPGKKASLLKANIPISKTLRPCLEESSGKDGSPGKFDSENVYIEGDNFEVLKILQESYLHKIKMIYIDPPYNTGNDFIYKDDFKKSREEYEEELGATDEDGGKLFRNTDTNGRFHSDWLSMMYERLLVARDLLRDDGVIFISIDEKEVANLSSICDEIFGSINYLERFHLQVRYENKSLNEDSDFQPVMEYVLIYAKNKDLFTPLKPSEPYDLSKFMNRIEELVEGETVDIANKRVTIFKSGQWKIRKEENAEVGLLKETWASGSIVKQGGTAAEFLAKYLIDRKPIDGLGVLYKIHNMGDDGLGYRYVTGPLKEDAIRGKFYSGVPISRLEEIKKGESLKYSPIVNFYNYSADFGNIRHEGGIPFNSGKKPVKMLKHLLTTSSLKENDLVLDFFSGSASLAHAVFEYNSISSKNIKFILVQLPEKTYEPNSKGDEIPLKSTKEAYDSGYKTIAEIGKERIRRAGKKILEELKEKDNQLKLDIGFRVFKVDTSNMKDVYYHPSELNKDMLFNLESNIKPDRSPEDLLIQVILDLGLELSLPIETRQILGNTVFVVQTNALVACFDDNIDFNIVDEIAELKPLKVVFKDASFSDDKDRINVTERFKRLSPETKVTVI